MFLVLFRIYLSHQPKQEVLFTLLDFCPIKYIIPTYVRQLWDIKSSFLFVMSLVNPFDIQSALGFAGKEKLRTDFNARQHSFHRQCQPIYNDINPIIQHCLRLLRLHCISIFITKNYQIVSDNLQQQNYQRMQNLINHSNLLSQFTSTWS